MRAFLLRAILASMKRIAANKGLRDNLACTRNVFLRSFKSLVRARDSEDWRMFSISSRCCLVLRSFVRSLIRKRGYLYGELFSHTALV